MLRHDIGDYIEEGYKPQSSFIPEEMYAAMLDSIVFACVDIFVVSCGKIVLAKRTRHPQADWFMFGGRMRTGESLSKAAQRVMKAEIGLQLEEDRFQYLTTWVGAWRKRAHAPEDNGSHNVSITMLLELSEQEVVDMQLNDEYSDRMLCTLDEILNDDSYHPALRQSVLALKRQARNLKT